jgi:hypothetical protein
VRRSPLDVKRHPYLTLMMLSNWTGLTAQPQPNTHFQTDSQLDVKNPFQLYVSAGRQKPSLPYVNVLAQVLDLCAVRDGERVELLQDRRVAFFPPTKFFASHSWLNIAPRGYSGRTPRCSLGYPQHGRGTSTGLEPC